MNLLARKRNGFTLLEVMIAITLMAIAFAAILTTQSAGISLSAKTKELNIAGWLAHRLMVESEQLYEGLSFEEVPKEESENFTAPFERYKWKREIKPIEFPELQLAQQNPSNPGGAETIQMITKIITKHLNRTVRELVITVTWPQGKGERTLVLSTYLVNLNEEVMFAL
jgi:prepilin-type N-terminal cleavage/methylation domain-containing protein